MKNNNNKIALLLLVLEMANVEVFFLKTQLSNELRFETRMTLGQSAAITP